VLASLLISANHAVTYDRLLQDVWGDEAWDMDHHVLQSHVTRLRTVVGRERVTQVNGSYELHALPGEIDAIRFEELVQLAVGAADAAATRSLCKEALELWRGIPYGDLADREFLQLEVRRLEEIRTEAIEECFRADLELGRAREIVGSLRSAVTEYPYDERFWEYYLLALRESGRHAEALEAYADFERILREEMDIEPPEHLRDLRESIASD
jgi:DNA-binding SARP family transcriptional activator